MYISGVEGKTSSAEQNKLAEIKSSSTNKTPKKNVDKLSDVLIVQKDMQKAFTFAYKACELKNVYACANLSQMYARGDGTEKNEEKAEKFKKMAIDMQDELKKSNKNINPTLGIHQIA